MSIKEITVHELKEKKDNNEDFLLIDVRENVEYLVSNLDGHHIPMGEIQNRLNEIKKHKNSNIYVMCRTGARSSRVTSFLNQKGFENVYNLKGGIKKWASEIDPSLPVA